MPVTTHTHRTLSKKIAISVFLVLAIFAFCSNSASAASPQQVDEAIKRATAYLLKIQKDGNWEVSTPPNAAKIEAELYAIRGGQWGGPTALATYALLASGENPQSEPMKKAMNFLANAKIVGIYALGLRSQVWSYLPAGANVRAMASRDGNLLLGAMRNFNGDAQGMFWYTAQGADYDHSASQYGILGMWACAQNGYETPYKFWANADNGWRKHQLKSGGWGYIFPRDKVATPTMTAAGVATLFITQDYLHSAEFAAMKGNTFDPAIEAGLKYMGENFNRALEGDSYYLLYGIERIGVAAGRKYLGKHNWYEEGSDALLKLQKADGSFGEPGDVNGQNGPSVASTSLAILFLVRGRAPVVLSKLEYNITPPKGKAAPGNWNARPRDVANLTRWLGKEMEHDLNWVSVNLDAPVDELNEAPILYIAGSQALGFTPDEKNKLRQYIEQGGMILANADAGNAAFSQSIVALGRELFPSYEFGELPASSIIYAEQFQRDKWKIKPSVQHMSNGARELIFLIPQTDPSKYWQGQVFAGHEEAHQLANNIALYAVEKKGLVYRGETFIIKRVDGVKSEKTLRMARLQYGGNWNPEAGGWRRLANVMHNEYKIDLNIENIELGKGLLKSGIDGFPVAHLTGTAAWTMPDLVAAELKAYIAAGGTLIVDSAGGNQEFAASMEANFAKIFPDGQAKNTAPLAAGSKVFSAATMSPTAIKWRAYSRKILGGLNAPRIRGIEVGSGKDSRIGVYFSAEDLSVGLVGQPIDGIIGYTPATATELVLDMILSATGNERKPVTQPTTQSATQPAAQPAAK